MEKVFRLTAFLRLFTLTWSSNKLPPTQYIKVFQLVSSVWGVLAVTMLQPFLGISTFLLFWAERQRATFVSKTSLDDGSPSK